VGVGLFFYIPYVIFYMLYSIFYMTSTFYILYSIFYIRVAHASGLHYLPLEGIA